MGAKERGREVFIGGGKEMNYPALLLFVAGLVLMMCAVHGQISRGHYVLPLAAGLLCALAGSALVAAKKDKRD